MWSQAVSVANNSTTQPCHLQARGQATGTCARHEAQYRYVLLEPIQWEWFFGIIDLGLPKSTVHLPQRQGPHRTPGSHKFQHLVSFSVFAIHKVIALLPMFKIEVKFSRVPNLLRLGSSYQALACCMNDKYSFMRQMGWAWTSSLPLLG